jgi:hypothetical protein
MRLELHETGQSQVEGVWVSAANIWEREPIGHDGASALRAQITVEEDAPVDVAEGEELEFAGARWRVAAITKTPRIAAARWSWSGFKRDQHLADEGQVCLSILITHSATSSRPRAPIST